MRKRTPIIEWQIAESEADWEGLQGTPLLDGEPVALHCRPLRRYWSVAVLCLLLVGVGDWWWRTTQAESHPAIAELPPTELQEPQTVRQGEKAVAISSGDAQSLIDWWYQQAQADYGLPTAVQAAGPEAHLDVELQTVAAQGDQVVVRVVTAAKNGRPAYRQTRFYQRIATGWRRTSPDATLWGTERSLETQYFVYHFRQNDAPAVIAVAPQIDAFYTSIWGNFGLPIIPTPEKLVIEVSVTQPPGHAAFWFDAPECILAPSPALYRTPVELTDAELLAQSLALPLLDDGLTQASERHAIGEAWQPMVNGLRLWQMSDLDLPLAAWREQVVKWIYVDGPALGSGQTFVLPDRYRELCAAHQLWLLSPAQLNIPLTCVSPESEEPSFPLWRLRNPLTHLDQLIVLDAHMARMDYHQTPHPGQTVALAILIEYAVVTYGRERLPALLAGLGHYDSWETLIPAVYGVSAAEFEAGWQAYLTTDYGVSPIRR